jgi:DNA ligase-4
MHQAREDPENVPNIYQRYVTAAQKKVLQGRKKAEGAVGAVADKKVNYAITKEDSIFPHITLPGGISSKATEYKELARKGDKWESPVFSLGNAGRSTNVPPAPRVVRKPHQTAQLGHQSAQLGHQSAQLGNVHATNGGVHATNGNTNGGGFGPGGTQLNGGGALNGGPLHQNGGGLNGNTLNGNTLNGNTLNGNHSFNDGFKAQPPAFNPIAPAAY